MIKIYQKIIDPVRGDCMQAIIASLLELPLHYVPKFIELGDKWNSTIRWFMREHGYRFEGVKYNKTLRMIEAPTLHCFKEGTIKWHNPSMMTPQRLYKEEGVNGLFYAVVFSPKFFKWDGSRGTHAVIIDRDYNIVHDPNPHYKGIKRYPLVDVIGYNGIIEVEIYNPIK